MPTLQLEKYFYTNVLVKAERNFKPEGEFSGSIKVDTKVSPISAEERRWEVTLAIKKGPKDGPSPYEFELETVGIFTVHPDFPKEEIENLIRIGGPSVLYSASREFLLMITARGPFGAVNIPNVTFQNKTKPKEEKKQHDPGPTEKDR